MAHVVRVLERDAAATVLAARSLPGVAHITRALVALALRAGASRVDVRVDLATWTVAVHHSGAARGGAAPASPPVLHAHLAHLGLLHVAEYDSPHACLLLQRGAQVLYAGPPPAPRGRRGTLVAVHGLYERIPVRRRLAARSAAAQARVRRHVRADVAAFAMARPDVHFSFVWGRTILLRAPRAPTLVQRFSAVHRVAPGRTAPIHAGATVRLPDAAACHVSLDGFVASALSATPTLQYVAVNGEPQRASDACARALRPCSVGSGDGDAHVPAALQSLRAHPEVIRAHTARCVRASVAHARAAPHRHPVFALRLTVSPAAPGAAGIRVRNVRDMLDLLLGDVGATAPAQPSPRQPSTRTRVEGGGRGAVTRVAAGGRAHAGGEHAVGLSTGGRGGGDAAAAPLSAAAAPPAAAPTWTPPSPHILPGARVVAQVDQRYILCAAREGRGPAACTLLLCMDQHAVDERVRLEAEVNAYVLACVDAGVGAAGKPTLIMATPAVFPVSLSGPARALLQFWAFDVRAADNGQVSVCGVPDVAGGRLARDTVLLRDMLDAFAAWSHAHDGVDRWLAAAADLRTDPHLTSAQRHWPPLFVHMLQSHACHGAIRFAVPLANEQCARLVTQLSETSFPFQCGMDLTNLRESLEHTEHTYGALRHTSDERLATEFRGAALQLTNLYKRGRENAHIAFQTGYAQALRDTLDMLALAGHESEDTPCARVEEVRECLSRRLDALQSEADEGCGARSAPGGAGASTKPAQRSSPPPRARTPPAPHHAAACSPPSAKAPRAPDDAKDTPRRTRALRHDSDTPSEHESDTGGVQPAAHVPRKRRRCRTGHEMQM
ncbi:DNA mismatch repair protein [Malassezia sp. CBS 17886]|nr:DNA mismatch repair protein [Malassezia sp. CBS 17886]